MLFGCSQVIVVSSGKVVLTGLRLFQLLKKDFSGQRDSMFVQ